MRINKIRDTLYGMKLSLFSLVDPNKKTGLTYPYKNCWVVLTSDERYITNWAMSDRGSKRLRTNKFRRYNYEGFVTVSPSDLVVDVGAFLGEFSIPASEIAERVISIEPDPDTHQCLRLQVKDIENIIPCEKLPADESKIVKFNTASDPSESSLITPDKTEFRELELQANPLDEILESLSVKNVNFMKVDAEGAEPEILRGVNDIPVEKFAIDTGPERRGNETTEEVIDILERQGYTVRVQEDENDMPITFAKQV